MMILEIAHLLIVPLFQLLPFLLTLIASLAPQLLFPLRYLFFCTFLRFKLCLHSTQYLALLLVVESHTVKVSSGTIKIIGCLLMIGDSVLIFLEEYLIFDLIVFGLRKFEAGDTEIML